MEDVIIIAEGCIKNESGYMDLTAETVGKSFIISSENHDGYEWKAKCGVEEAFCCLVKSMGIEKVEEVLNKLKVELK